MELVFKIMFHHSDHLCDGLDKAGYVKYLAASTYENVGVVV